jgi:DNA-binding CsgD family transcriptional regulator
MDDQPDMSIDWLTKREIEILCAIAKGLSAKEVAKQLTIAPRTVERHIDHIRLKTRTRNRSHMVAFAIANGLV